MKTPEIVVGDKQNGEGMVIHYRTSEGTDIFGLAIPNMYTHADWDLGPTWCYLISGNTTTLIDTGRLGNFEVFSHLLKATGKEIAEIDTVVITHCHEDHDGNMAEILSASGAELCAHELYESMISYHGGGGAGVVHPEFPGSCRLCRMPEKFYKSCLPYHRKRSSLKVDITIKKDNQELKNGRLSFLSTPGHTADSICVVLEDKVIFTGDTVLPEITAQPSTAYMFNVNRDILPKRYRKTNSVYGLLNFIKSLSRVAAINPGPFEASFPAHRLFNSGRFNLIDSGQRARDIIRFHMERCRDVLKIIEDKPATIDDIITRHFPPSRIAGMGKSLADNEIRAHLELMEGCGDIIWRRDEKDVIEPTGMKNCLGVIASYLG